MLNINFVNKKNTDLYKEIAKLHMSSINQGFLSTLGHRFLALLYEAIDPDSNSILFVTQVNNKIIGFVSGSSNMRSIYKQMLKSWPKLFLTLLPVILRPTKIKRIAEIIWFSQKQKPILDCPKAELFSIAVVKEERMKGVAENLYKRLSQFFIEKNENAFCIVVGNNLTNVHRFYQRMGAVALGEIEVHKEQSSTLYKQELLLKEIG